MYQKSNIRLFSRAERIRTETDNMCSYRFLLTSEDHSFPPDLQRMLSQEAQTTEGADITIEEIASGHSPFLSKPEETVDFFLRAVAAFR